MSKSLFAISLSLALCLLAIISPLYAMGKLDKKKSMVTEKSKPANDTQATFTTGQAQNHRILVTFVELGSINCIPCKMMQPVMAEIEKEYASRVKVVFYDVWTEAGRPFAEQYQIRAIPTQVFLDKDGKEFYRHIGFFPKEDIVKILKQQGVK